MAMITGIPGLVGAVLLLAVGAFGDAVEATYGLDDDTAVALGLPRPVLC